MNIEIKNIFNKIITKNLISLIAGILLPYSLSPYNYYAIIFISISLLIYSISDCSIKRAFFRGYLFGVSSFTCGVGWLYVSIHEHGNAGPLLAGFLTMSLILLVLAFFPAIKLSLYKYLYAKFNNISSNIKLIVLFPSIWVIIDWVQSWIFTGFPWLYIGYSQTNTVLNGYAPIISIYGLSFIVALICCYIYLIINYLIQFIQNNKNKHSLHNILNYLIIISIIFISGNSLQHIQWTTKSTNTEKAVLIQGNISQNNKWTTNSKFYNMQKYINLTNPYWKDSTIIWPETAITSPRHNVNDFIQGWQNKAKYNNSTLIFGVPVLSTIHHNNHKQYFNTISAIGLGSGEYYKNKLVPWGEYVPLEKFLRGIISFFDLPMSSFISGNVLSPHFSTLKSQYITWLPFICYEIAYPEYVISHAKQGNAIITISNDAWFGNSIGPWQHLQLAQMRALETARPVIRTTNNGITAVINTNGQIAKQIPQFTEGVLVQEVNGYSGITPIMYIGVNSIIILCLIIILSIGAINYFKKI